MGRDNMPGFGMDQYASPPTEHSDKRTVSPEALKEAITFRLKSANALLALVVMPSDNALEYAHNNWYTMQVAQDLSMTSALLAQHGEVLEDTEGEVFEDMLEAMNRRLNEKLQQP